MSLKREKNGKRSSYPTETDRLAMKWHIHLRTVNLGTLCFGSYVQCGLVSHASKTSYSFLPLRVCQSQRRTYRVPWFESTDYRNHGLEILENYIG